MRIRHAFAITTLLLAGAAQAQSTPVEQWQIIEGKGLTDNYVFLGMSRKQAIAIDQSGNCALNRFQCVFSALNRPDTPTIVLTFNDKAKVIRIEVTSSNSAIKWPTTAGATDDMTGDQVQALYPRSVLTDVGTGVQVTAARQGYQFTKVASCAPFEPCPVQVTHTIVKRSKGG